MILSSRKGGNMNLQQAKNYTTKLLSINWVKRVHEGSKPANTSAEKKFKRYKCFNV